jgi:hypothetical protein
VEGARLAVAITQLLDGTIRVCKDLSPSQRTEWKLEVTGKDGAIVVLGIDFPLREFLGEVLDLYQDDYPAQPSLSAAGDWPDDGDEVCAACGSEMCMGECEDGDAG